MSDDEKLEALRARFPHHTIRQAPDENCHACKGSGVVGPTKRGTTAPCWCAVSSEPHGASKTEFMRAIGNAAKRALRDMEGER